jgi:exopolysaccharide production protein ExoZ
VRPTEGRSTYIYGADIVRFASGVLVALFHLTWLEKSVSTVAWYGWIGVQIFFVMSGFVIARSANDTTPMRFAVSRFLRLYPAAWICAVISLAIFACTQGIGHINMGLLMGFCASLVLYPTGPFIASAYWTLPIEISFYGLILLILVKGQFRHIERIAVALCGISSIYIIAYSLQCAGVIGGAELEFHYGWKNIFLLRHGIYFAFGIFLWLWSERLLTRMGAAFWILCFMMAPLEITCRSAELIALMPVPLRLDAVWPVPVVIWLVSCALLAASTLWRSAIARLPPLLLRGVRCAGLVTYPLYLIHESLGEATLNILIKLGCPYLPSAIVALGVAGVVALFIAMVMEPALRTLLRHWLQPGVTQAQPQARWQRLQRSGGSL